MFVALRSFVPCPLSLCSVIQLGRMSLGKKEENPKLQSCLSASSLPQCVAVSGVFVPLSWLCVLHLITELHLPNLISMTWLPDLGKNHHHLGASNCELCHQEACPFFHFLLLVPFSLFLFLSFPLPTCTSMCPLKYTPSLSSPSMPRSSLLQ